MKTLESKMWPDATSLVTFGLLDISSMVHSWSTSQVKKYMVKLEALTSIFECCDQISPASFKIQTGSFGIMKKTTNKTKLPVEKMLCRLEERLIFADLHLQQNLPHT